MPYRLPHKSRRCEFEGKPFLQKKFKVRIGYSDHSLNNSVGIAAVSLGAEVIEKHFTISKNYWDQIIKLVWNQKN